MLIYPNQNIVNNHVDYKSISILITRYNPGCIQTSYSLSQYFGL